MSMQKKLLLGCVAAIGGLSLAASTQAAQLWGTGFETNGLPGSATQVDSSVTAPHSGDFSAQMTDNTSHHWNSFNLPVGNLPILGPGESFGSVVFSFWAKTIESDSPSGETRWYQIAVKSNLGNQDVLWASTPTAAGEWHYGSADLTAVFNANHDNGATSVDNLFIQGSSNSFASLDNYYLDDVSIDYTIVPEPASMGIVGLGALALLAKRRRSA